MKRNKCQAIASAIANGSDKDILCAIKAALEGEEGRDWNRYFGYLADFVRDGVPRFTVVKLDGNSKLPFAAFSSLPGAGFCPGAGECLKFCYSFRAWRYPAAFARQCQNAILMRSEEGRAAILDSLDKAQKVGQVLDFRLYVDGDFGNVGEVEFWMNALRDRPWLKAYGYSKSFEELQAYAAAGGIWPANYLLNLSSGHRHSDATKADMWNLSITRGEFIAVNIGRKVKSSDHGNRVHQAELREAYGAKAFTCPGKCGTCTAKGHACGAERFRGIPIIIAVH